jgi:hypothetical protein
MSSNGTVLNDDTPGAGFAHDCLAKHVSHTGAGLILEEDTGTRRSSRSRIRPLQYWRNEHKQYGREHRTMPTVVGIQTRTPNPQWPMNSTGHAAKKSKARTKQAA